MFDETIAINEWHFKEFEETEKIITFDVRLLSQVSQGMQSVWAARDFDVVIEHSATQCGQSIGNDNIWFSVN